MDEHRRLTDHIELLGATRGFEAARLDRESDPLDRSPVLDLSLGVQSMIHSDRGEFFATAHPHSWRCRISSGHPDFESWRQCERKRAQWMQENHLQNRGLSRL